MTHAPGLCRLIPGLGLTCVTKASQVSKYAWLLLNAYFKISLFSTSDDHPWSERISFCNAERKSSPCVCEFISGTVRGFNISISEMAACHIQAGTPQWVSYKHPEYPLSIPLPFLLQSRGLCGAEGFLEKILL